MIAAALADVLTTTRDALAALEVTVTDDPHAAAGAVAAGETAVLVIASPSIDYTTISRRTLTWTVWVMTGTDDPATALGRFEPLLEALVPALMPDTARPQTYTIGDRECPGYDLTFTTEHI